MGELEYPYCEKFEGLRKIKCLIRAIMRDKSISKAMKKRRIVYLIALNKKHKWTKMETVRKMVDDAVSRLEKKKKSRKGGKKTTKKKKKGRKKGKSKIKSTKKKTSKKKKRKRKISKKAVLSAIKSKKTPKHLKEGLRKYAKKRGWL